VFETVRANLWENLTIYLLLSPFFLLISSSSLRYYAATYSPSESQLNEFLDSLKFPFNLNDANPREIAINALLHAKPYQGMVTRIFFSLIPGLFIAIKLFDVLGHPDNIPRVIDNVWWAILYSVTLALCWGFGRKLKRIPSNRNVNGNPGHDTD
jgi:hypothetical protein